MQIILLERVEKLGQMGDVVKVKPGYARNFLLPQRKALRATKANIERFEGQRGELEAHSLELQSEAKAVAAKLDGFSCVLLRQASDSAQLYGSVTSRDVAAAAHETGVRIDRSQVQLDRPIKTLGVHGVRVVLHPEVVVSIDVNVARTAEEAEAQMVAFRTGGHSAVEESRRTVDDDDVYAFEEDAAPDAEHAEAPDGGEETGEDAEQPPADG